MPGLPSAYLVLRLEEGFGDVYPMMRARRYTLGRVATNDIVLKDDLSSREHAEVSYTEGRWRVCDNDSMNGTRVNGTLIEGSRELTPGDDIHLGKTRLVFVEDMSQLPPLSLEPAPDESLEIKKRLIHTRFLTPNPLETEKVKEGTDVETRHRVSQELSRLYRMALEMGSSGTYQELVEKVLDGLMEAIPADSGAILSIREGVEPETVAQRHQGERAQGYVKISQFVSKEVMASHEAILAEDVKRDQSLRDRESLTELKATSLICAPVTFGENILGLIHLYCTDPARALDAEHLEFAVAVAKQLGAATFQMQRQAQLTAENRTLRHLLLAENELVGDSAVMKEVEDQIARVAATSATVLIRGESGTGKELLARAIHYNSPRRAGPIVCLNCAALPETLLESELFGHEKGAFTGATEKKVGKFEAADHGTIFLDEIGEMNPGTQSKLLRVLEGHPFERVGGNAPIRVDVRVVSATNRELEQAVQSGAFRRDLFFRLQVVEIRIPPLRERRGDVPLLAEHFLKRFVRETGRKFKGFTPAALRKMEEYKWPGNVRELRNMIERAVALGTGPVVDAKDIWLSSIEVASSPTFVVPPASYEPMDLEEMEKRHILRTLEHTEWNKSQAAGILKIERSTLDRKIKHYQLKRS